MVPVIHVPIIRRAALSLGLSLEISLVCALGLGLVTPCGGQAPSSAVDTTRAASLPARLATITTDTGDFALGHRDFSRYDTPGWCRAAALTTLRILRRSLAAQESLDTLSAMPAQDTQPAGVTTLARACGARFRAAGTPAADLPDLFKLALREQDDTLALAVLARQMALAPTAAVRDALRMDAIEMMIGINKVETGRFHDIVEFEDAAEPARLKGAEVLIAQIDALGPSARVAQMKVHAVLLSMLQASGVEGYRVRKEAERVIALWQKAAGDQVQADMGGWTVQTAYRALVLQTFLEHPDSLPMLAQRARQDMSKIKDSKNFNKTRMDPATPIHAVLEQLAPEGYTEEGWHELLTGQGDTSRASAPAFHLQADYWFPYPAHSRDTIVPVPGKVNLIVSGTGSAVASYVRKWLTQYGPHGLVVTIVGSTEGVFANWIEAENNNDPLGPPLPPAAEADSLRMVIQDVQRLPVTVAVQKNKFVWRPDGKREGKWAMTQFISQLHGAINSYDDDPGIVMLIGRDGKVKYVKEGYVKAGWKMDLEPPQLTVLITKLLGILPSETSPSAQGGSSAAVLAAPLPQPGRP